MINREGAASAGTIRRPCASRRTRAYLSITIRGLRPGRLVVPRGARRALGGKVVTLSPTPLAEIPRHAVARYLEEGGAQIPVVALYWDSGELTVAGPGFAQTFSSDREAREAFVRQGEAIRQWEMPWPESVPRGPNGTGRDRAELPQDASQRRQAACLVRDLDPRALGRRGGGAQAGHAGSDHEVVEVRRAGTRRRARRTTHGRWRVWPRRASEPS